MTDANEAANTKAPTHLAYHVREGRTYDDKSFWTRIGAAWQHKDGKGFSIQLDAQPVDGRITLRIASDSK